MYKDSENVSGFHIRIRDEKFISHNLLFFALFSFNLSFLLRAGHFLNICKTSRSIHKNCKNCLHDKRYVDGCMGDVRYKYHLNERFTSFSFRLARACCSFYLSLSNPCFPYTHALSSILDIELIAEPIKRDPQQHWFITRPRAGTKPNSYFFHQSLFSTLRPHEWATNEDTEKESREKKKLSFLGFFLLFFAGT